MYIEGLKWQISFRWAFEIKSQDPVGDTYLRSLQVENKKEMDLFLFVSFFVCFEIRKSEMFYFTHFKIMHYLKVIWLWEPIWFHFKSRRNHETVHIRVTTVSEEIASSLWLLIPIHTKHNKTGKKHMDTNSKKTRPKKTNVLWFLKPRDSVYLSWSGEQDIPILRSFLWFPNSVRGELSPECLRWCIIQAPCPAHLHFCFSSSCLLIQLHSNRPTLLFLILIYI